MTDEDSGTGADGEADDEPAGANTAPDGTPIARRTAPERWESVGRRALVRVLQRHREDVTREIEEAIAAIEFGAPVSTDHVDNLREAVGDLEATVECDLADLVEDADSREGSVVPRERADGPRERSGDGDEVARPREEADGTGPG